MRFTMVVVWCALALGGLLAGAAAPMTVVPEAPPVLVFAKAGMVSARALAELCGATVTSAKGIITLTRGEKTFTFSLGKIEAKQDGKPITLPMAPFLYATLGFVPAEACVTALGGTATISDDMLTMAVTFDGVTVTLPMEPQMGTPDDVRKMSLDIFLVSLADGSAKQLTYDMMNRTLMNLRTARFTADGASLLYERGFDVYTRKFDSPNGSNLTAAAGKDGLISAAPVPCPDGAVLIMQLNPNADPAAPPLPGLCRIDAQGEITTLATGARPQVSQDGKLIAYTAIDTDQQLTAHVMNADGTGDKALGEGLLSAFSPDGATALVLVPTFTEEKMLESVSLRQVQVADGAALHADDPLPAVMEGPAYAFSPDGTTLALALPQMGLMLVKTDRSEKTPLTVGPDMAPQFTPDGQTVLFLRDRKLYAVPVAGGEPKAIAPHLMVLDYSISPDGTQVLAVGATEATIEALTPKPPPSKVPAGKYTAPTQQEIDAAKKAGTRAAVIKTARGDITVELYGKDAPLTVANFVKLAQAKFYDGLNFHRVEPGFVVQGGDPNGDGTGGPGYTINREISPTLRHVKGALAMARAQDPNSAGCQFYITLDKTEFLDDEYAVFGKVIKGMDVVEKIAVGDAIVSITVK